MDTQNPYGLEEPDFYPQGITLIVLSALAICLDVPALLFHYKHKNLAFISLVVWFIILNTLSFINAIVWPNDFALERWKGYGLCDVEAKLILGSWLGPVGAIGAIFRRLAIVMDTKNTVLNRSKSQERRDLVIDIGLCWGGPVYLMAVQYIVQDNRFNLWAISGCNPSTDNSWPTDVLIFMWPLIFTLYACYFATLLVIRVYRYRAEFTAILRNSNTSKSRFIRLFAMSMVMLLGFLPIEIWIFYENESYQHLPYSWNAIHTAQWNEIPIVPTFGRVTYDRWVWVACGFLVFIFFGTGADAITLYKGWLKKIGVLALVHKHFPARPKNLTPSWTSWGAFGQKAKKLLGRRSLSMERDKSQLSDEMGILYKGSRASSNAPQPWIEDLRSVHNSSGWQMHSILDETNLELVPTNGNAPTDIGVASKEIDF